MVTMWREMEVRSKKQEFTKRNQSIIGIQLKAQQNELNVTKKEQEGMRREQEDTPTKQEDYAKGELLFSSVEQVKLIHVH